MMEPPRLLMVFFFVLGPQFPSPTVSQFTYPGFNILSPSNIPVNYAIVSRATPVPASVPSPPSADPTDPCPAVKPQLFTAHQRNCFHFSTDQATWAGARTKCQEIGQKYGSRFDLAELGNPNNLGSDDWLIETIARRGGSAPPHGQVTWLGGHSPRENDQWIWAYTGRALPLDFPLWGQSEPNGDGWCIDVHLYGNQGRYYMNDLPCTQKRYYVCQQFP